MATEVEDEYKTSLNWETREALKRAIRSNFEQVAKMDIFAAALLLEDLRRSLKVHKQRDNEQRGASYWVDKQATQQKEEGETGDFRSIASGCFEIGRDGKIRPIDLSQPPSQAHLFDPNRLEWEHKVSPRSYTWAAANKYAASIGAGWRLPTVTELGHYVANNPPIQGLDDRDLSDTIWSDAVWTSTPDALPQHRGFDFVWIIDLERKSVHYERKVAYARVLCVREVDKK
jgi:hypothetical protein